MLYVKSLEYVYVRSKNILESETGEPELFIFAGLNFIEKSTFENKTKKKVKAVFSKVIEIPILKSPKNYLNLPNDDSRYHLDVDEFKRLERLAVEDEEAFMLYRHK